MASSSFSQEEMPQISHSELTDLEAIGQGGFGVAYRAKHGRFGTVVYKKLNAEKLGDRISYELKKEARVCFLQHVNIVALLAIIFENGHYGIVMEYVLHGALNDFIFNYDVDWPLKLSLAHDIVCGMNYLHSQHPPVIHSDLKTENILVSDTLVAKICDFGLAKWKQQAATQTTTGHRRGTVAYMAPEVFKNPKVARTTKYDVYSFGIVFWELLTEQQPYEYAITEEQITAAIAYHNNRPPLDAIKGPAAVLVSFAMKWIPLCWHQSPDERPTFDKLEKLFAEIRQVPAGNRPQTSFTVQPQTFVAAQPPLEQLPEDINIIQYGCLRNLVMLAEGGSGVFYSAEHEDWGTFTYKELKTSIIKPESRLAKDLIHEAQMHTFRHPNVVMLFAIIFEPQHYGVLFEYAMYGALDGFYEDYEVQWPMKLQISQGVIRGMNYLHTKNPPILHGNLKVQKVLIGDDYEAKLCDFGLAKWRLYSTTKTNIRWSLYSTTKTNIRSQRGTVTHIPPENWRDIIAPRTVKFDIYSFGIMLWELLTEDIAFAGAPVRDIQAAVINGQRPDLLQLQGADNFKEFARTCIEKCWNGEPDQRPTFGELNGEFDVMLTTNKAAVDEAKRHLDEQTSRTLPLRPMEATDESD